jgi:hypothetical protein
MATTTAYTDQASFNAATTGIVDSNFSGIATTSPYFVAEPTSFILNGIGYSTSGPGNFINITNPTFYGSSPPFATTTLGVFNPTTSTTGSPVSFDLTINFAPVTAVAVDFGSLFGTGSATISVSDGTSGGGFPVDNAAAGYSFVGFTSSTVDLTSLTIVDASGLNQGLLLNDVQLGSYAPVPTPEASGLLTFGTLLGLSGLMVLFAKRRNVKSY